MSQEYTPKCPSNRELLLRQQAIWQERNRAGRPVFNFAFPPSDYDKEVCLVSKSKNGNQPEYLFISRNELDLLQHICSFPLSMKENTTLLYKSPFVIKNKLSRVFKQMKVSEYPHNSLHELIFSLLEKGMLFYEPSVQTDSFTNFDPKKK